MSKSVHLEEIPYCADGCDLFERVRDLPGAAFLDSSFPHSTRGRFDIIAAQPVQDGFPACPGSGGSAAATAWFDDLAAFHRERYAGIQPVSQDIPFCGGVLGYIGYDFGNRLFDITPPRAGTLPPAHLAAYDWCLVQDHLLRRAALVALPSLGASRREDLLRRLRRAPRGRRDDFRLLEPFAPDMPEAAYRAAFNRVEAYILAGDCYQVNLAQRFTAPCDGDPWFAYRRLRPVAGAPFAAYLALPAGGALLSLSPERFMSLHGQRVETSPIKGTRPRSSDPRADRLAERELRASAKDRAENLMIVDLLRNDLGRSCVPGSIHVDRLFEVQKFATVHHLVSTIRGELSPDRRAWELLRDSFPGGSITGAPKRRAMQIIAELETHGREAYCGSVLYASADGRMDSNIAIRSFACSDGSLRCWAGGGIVADSRWQEEYQECWDKVGPLLTALEDDTTSG
jgi:para-aminobenzoate synthetase component 1